LSSFSERRVKPCIETKKFTDNLITLGGVYCDSGCPWLGHIIFAYSLAIGLVFCPGQILPFGFETAQVRIAPGIEHQFGKKGEMIRATIWVTPDYLSIGSDEDFLRIPLTRPTAVMIADEFGSFLPTRKIVDAIVKQADFRFKPQPLPPGRMMRSSEYYIRHNAMIEEQRKGRPLGELLAGHKKDVVLSNRLLGPERIAIYGWHKKDGRPIQPLSTVHGARYADYSHGVRLVFDQICINGELYSIYDVLLDPKLAPVLSYEGLIPKIKRLMDW